MPQFANYALNKTIYGTNLSRATVPPDSVSIRITDLSVGGYVELYSVTWGIPNALNPALDAFDYCPLLIICNEIFNPDFDYAVPNVADLKNVVWQDEIVREIMFVHRDFSEPFRLTEANNYLIIVPAPTQIGTPATLYDVVLTVRGEVYRTPPPTSQNISDRKR